VGLSSTICLSWHVWYSPVSNTSLFFLFFLKLTYLSRNWLHNWIRSNIEARFYD
jgi:hypothetical protein